MNGKGFVKRTSSNLRIANVNFFLGIFLNGYFGRRTMREREDQDDTIHDLGKSVAPSPFRKLKKIEDFSGLFLLLFNHLLDDLHFV